MRIGRLLFFFLLASIPSLAFLTYAQLGEQAGQPFFNISVGGSSTFNYSIFNAGSTPIGYKVILPTLNTIPHNSTPTVAVTPMNGTLAPNSQQRISMTVYMPSSDKPGLKWEGILQVVEVSAPQSTTGTGAVIRAGVAKIVTIESAQAKPNAFWVIIPSIIVIVVVAGGAGLYFRHKKLAAARKKRKGKIKRKARRKKGLKHKKPSAARKKRKGKTRRKARSKKKR